MVPLTGCISTGRLFALGAKGCRFKSYHSDLLLTGICRYVRRTVKYRRYLCYASLGVPRSRLSVYIRQLNTCGILELGSFATWPDTEGI